MGCESGCGCGPVMGYESGSLKPDIDMDALLMKVFKSNYGGFLLT